MAARIAQYISDRIVHRLDCEGSCAVYGPVEPKLAVASGIGARPAGGIRDGNIGLGVDRIGSGLAPQSRGRKHDLHGRAQTQRQGWLDVDHVSVSGVTCKREVIAVGKQRIECPKTSLDVAVT